jgi:hypothetical protein
MRKCSGLLIAAACWVACDVPDEGATERGALGPAEQTTNTPTSSASGPDAGLGLDGTCTVRTAAKFYMEATQVDYDYEPRSPEELLKRSSLVVRGRVVGIGESSPETPLSASDVETALKVQVEHVYRGTVQQGQPLYVVMARSPIVTRQDLEARARMIPDASVTLFLGATKSRPSELSEGGRVLRPSSPQGFLISTDCGIAQPLDAKPLFSGDVNSTEALHAAMLRLVPSDPCKSQCPLATVDDSCVERPFESFAPLETTRVEWMDTYCHTAEPDPTDSFPYSIEARCGDGKRLLYRGTGVSIERRYYTAEGAFLALETGGDGGQGADCHDSAYWPERIDCQDAVVVRVDCGSGTFKVGQHVPL